MPPYVQVRKLLLRYLSPILVDSVLDQALKKRDLSPETLSPSQLDELASDIMVGLRLFVAKPDLPELMLGLAEILDAEEL